ncbi:hypothetical protein E2C01_028377 [Portunus trituberculatus]|uniref:Uncharacterized protein n=1 Tax=Portunus trituberculatus TaxID=210409 RepID=A0A5B7EL72_PORTR|nr:hypothetical protein [Portunus trituberculatus]
MIHMDDENRKMTSRPDLPLPGGLIYVRQIILKMTLRKNAARP